MLAVPLRKILQHQSIFIFIGGVSHIHRGLQILTNMHHWSYYGHTRTPQSHYYLQLLYDCSLQSYSSNFLRLTGAAQSPSCHLYSLLQTLSSCCYLKANFTRLYMPSPSSLVINPPKGTTSALGELLVLSETLPLLMGQEWGISSYKLGPLETV